MTWIEKLLGALIIIVMITRLIFPFAYSSIVITLLMLILSMLYFWFGFAILNNIRFRHIFKNKFYKDISVLRILGTIVTGFVLSLVIIYALFKFQRWPYGNIGLRISLCGLLIIAIVVFMKYLSSKHQFYSNFLIRLFLIGILATSLYFVSSETLLELQHRDYPEYVEAEKNLMKDPQNRELLQKANEERQKMDLNSSHKN